MKRFCFLVVFVFLLVLSFAQKNIVYNVENGIDKIEQQYIDTWKKIKKTDGFRIQITSFSGVNSKIQIDAIAEQFKQIFPDILCVITYFEPNFRLRAGNYYTKLEAYKAIQKISLFFPGAFVVKDQIDFK